MLASNDHVDTQKKSDEELNDVDFHRFDEQVNSNLIPWLSMALEKYNQFFNAIYSWCQVNICLECGAKQLSQLQRRFLRCSSQATVTHLKKFIALKVLDSIDAYRDVDILCNDELLGKDHTLKFVILTRWRFKDPPLKLVYRPRVDLL